MAHGTVLASKFAEAMFSVMLASRPKARDSAPSNSICYRCHVIVCGHNVAVELVSSRRDGRKSHQVALQ